MEIEKTKAIIEAILFSVGRPVEIKELVMVLELSPEDIIQIIENMKAEFEEQKRGIEIIKINDAYQLCTKKEYFEYIYPIVDKRNKPNLSQAAMETLAIIAYNPKVTRAEIESIRGVNSDGTIYKLLEHNLIEDAGKLDAPGRPSTYKTTDEFLRLFGYSSLEELPELPRYKLDENQQIVIEDIIKNNEEKNKEDIDKAKDIQEKEKEAPMPEREENKLKNKNENE